MDKPIEVAIVSSLGSFPSVNERLGRDGNVKSRESCKDGVDLCQSVHHLHKGCEVFNDCSVVDCFVSSMDCTDETSVGVGNSSSVILYWESSSIQLDQHLIIQISDCDQGCCRLTDVW